MGKQGVAQQWHQFVQQSREQESAQRGQEAACFHFPGSSRVQPSIETVMVTTQQNSWTQVETQTSRRQLFQAHACTQTDLPRTERAAQSFSGGEFQNLEVPKGSEDWGGCHGCKRSQMDEFFKNEAKLREEISMQHSIQESERDTDAWYYTVTWPEWQPCLRSLQGEACFQPWTDEQQWHAR